MSTRNIVAIGASSGGFEAVRFIANHLPAGFSASILVTLHLPSQVGSRLDEVLSSAGSPPFHFARDGESLENGKIYLAPPDRHLLLAGDRIALGAGPRENLVRPAIDPMFRSVGLCCGFRAIGVILTGALDDGAAGLADMQRQGAIAVVQSPADAACPDMPAAALDCSAPDHIVDLRDMPKLLSALVEKPAGEPRPASDRLRLEVDIARGKPSQIVDMDQFGRSGSITCPDCGGVLWETDERGQLRYRCHTGHAYTADILKLALDDTVRQALATALRALGSRLN
jgi:two-component system chemotaxis response regulator CheB